MSSILLMGGSFNPIHYGHLRIALEGLECLGCERVWLLPNGLPPHRLAYEIKAKHRLAMLEQVCAADAARFELCRFEIDRPEISYTVDTVAALREAYPQHRFAFVTGIDAVYDYRWKEFDRLLGQLENFLVASRPGYDFEALLERLSDVPNRDRLRPLAVPLHEISSSLIRERLRQGRSVRYWVPDGVEAYLAREALYRS